MIIPLLLLSNAFNVPNNLVPNSNLVRYESVGLVSAQLPPCDNKVCVKDCCDTLGICNKSTDELEAACLAEKTACVEVCQLAKPNCKIVANC